MPHITVTLKSAKTHKINTPEALNFAVNEVRRNSKGVGVEFGWNGPSIYNPINWNN